MSIRVLLDCDNTAGIPGYEIDDALALLYLASHPSVELLGVTTTFGNGPEEAVHAQTRWLLDLLRRSDIPLYRGATEAGDWDTPAARFLAEVCGKGPVHIVAIGPLSNVAGAHRAAPAAIASAEGIYAMGGYTGPLRFPARQVSELNLSCDPEAAYRVLSSNAPLHLMSAQVCLNLPFRRKDLLDLKAFPRWFRRMVGEWYLQFSSAVGVDAFYLWDLVPILRLLEPGSVRDRLVRITSTEEDLRTGTLLFASDPSASASVVGAPGVVNLPDSIADPSTLMPLLRGGWARALNVESE